MWTSFQKLPWCGLQVHGHVRKYSSRYVKRNQWQGDELRRGRQLLKASGIEDYEASSRFLFEAAKGDQVLFESYIVRRANGEPTQYILGEWDFHNITLLMRKPVLIPRPETEDLVEWILGRRSRADLAKNNSLFLDACCGTGAIGLALLHENLARSCIAIDIDSAAVQLSKENATRLGFNSTRYEVFDADVTSFKSLVLFDFIVSNPPYIPSKNIRNLQREVKDHESIIALNGGPDGSNIPRKVLTMACRCLKPSGECYIEVDDTHSDSVVKQWITEDKLPMELVESAVDFRGVQRFHVLRLTT